MTKWDGSLTVRGNAIIKATSINFWNANQPLRQSGQTLSWQSSTTGGLSGVIIELEERDAGSIDVSTEQGQFSADLKSIGIEPKVWEYGGLKKTDRALPPSGKTSVRRVFFQNDSCQP